MFMGIFNELPTKEEKANVQVKGKYFPLFFKYNYINNKE
jgi:hypothetical protein